MKLASNYVGTDKISTYKLYPAAKDIGFGNFNVVINNKFVSKLFIKPSESLPTSVDSLLNFHKGFVFVYLNIYIFLSV